MNEEITAKMRRNKGKRRVTKRKSARPILTKRRANNKDNREGGRRM